MNIAIPLILALIVFIGAYKIYSRYLAITLNLDPSRLPPSISKCDNVDFVPTKLGIVFSHHFASIAGGGPILGPTLALIYGYQLPLLWIVLGCIFFGAVHDFVALFISVREGGRSIGEVARKTIGEIGFFLFIAFTIVSLIMVIVSFLGATVAALTSKYPLELMGLSADQTLLKTVVENGIIKGKIGGIASTSVFVITSFAPILGFLLYIKKIPAYIAAIIAIGVCAVSIWIGLIFPITIEPSTWRIILCIYIFAAAGIPVWIILQPRDFTNSFILYFGIAAMAFGILYGGLKHISGASDSAAQFFKINAPAFNFTEGSRALGSVWPILFITIACGAISGFHSLVASGTSSKQLSNEKDIRIIGYGGMLLEGILATAVLAVVASGLDFAKYRDIVFPSVATNKSNPILAFALALGSILNHSTGIPTVYGTVFGILLVEGFVVTTLDTAVRLCRYLLEELWAIIFKKIPAILKSYYFNAGIIVVVSYILSVTNTIDKVWPIFGTANQLLAAFVLMVSAVWLTRNKKSSWFAILPALFMLATSIASLFYLLVVKYWKTMNIPLIIADLLLLSLAAGFVVMIVKTYTTKKDKTANNYIKVG